MVINASQTFKIISFHISFLYTDHFCINIIWITDVFLSLRYFSLLFNHHFSFYLISLQIGSPGETDGALKKFFFYKRKAHLDILKRRMNEIWSIFRKTFRNCALFKILGMYSCWEIFIYRYEMCKEFSEPSTKLALMQPKIRESSNISFNISYLGYY